MGSGFRGFDFSHERVKRVVGLLKGFVHAIASAPREFLYLSYLEINEDKRKKGKKWKKKEKKAPYFLDSLRYLVFLLQLLYFRI